MKGFFCISLLFFLLIVFGCGQNKKGPEPTPAPSATPFTCFNDIDSTTSGDTRGCMGMFYKNIRNNYVLAITYDNPIQYDSCVHIIIDTINSEKLSNLIVYKEGNASLFRYCNDYGADQPLRTLKKAYGDMYIRFFKPTRYTGGDKPTVSIWINQLNFIDTAGNKNIIINKELFWKVDDWRVPAG